MSYKVYFNLFAVDKLVITQAILGPQSCQLRRAFGSFSSGSFQSPSSVTIPSPALPLSFSLPALPSPPSTSLPGREDGGHSHRTQRRSERDLGNRLSAGE